jgi:1-acyl-sn-glycerol-3-phosphate acyltransferase
MSWRHPGKVGALIYAVAAGIVGIIVGSVSRLQIARQRGRASTAARLPNGPLIVISNHTSYADGLLLALASRRMGRSLRLLATSGVFSAPVIGRLARRLGFIPVKRGTADAAHSLDAAVAALSQGEAVGLYPEGRISRDPHRWPERSKTGAVRLALLSGAPIVPVAMDGAHRIVGAKRIATTLFVNLFRRPEVDTLVGEPIDVRALMHIGPAIEPTHDEVRHAADLVMGRLVALLAELRNETPEHPHGAPRVEA